MGQLDLFNSKNTISGYRICITGNFGIDTRVINAKFKMLGVEIDFQPTKFTHLIFIGDHPKIETLEKLRILKHDGFSIPISQSKVEFYEALDYGTSPYQLKDVEKNISIDYDFIFDNTDSLVEMPDAVSVNPLYQKNIFVDLDKIDYNLWQMLGNIGAFSYNIFEPSDIDYIWLSRQTVDNLKNGIKDSTIAKIERVYNESSSIKFFYKFIIGEAVLSFLQRRFKIDEYSTKLLNAYLDSNSDKIG